MSEEISARVGDYQILNELGSGGMGRVYRVRNVISDRIEAMKVLLPDLVGRRQVGSYPTPSTIRKSRTAP